MDRYDYRQNVKAAVKDYIEWNYGPDYEELKEMGRDKAFDTLYDDMFVADDVTGNASGSFYCNAYKAEEAIAHNLDLLAEAVEEFGGCLDVLKDGAEACDVTIRCYVLGECLGSVLDEMEDDGTFDEEAEEEDQDGEAA